ncbi:MAG TPA: cellulose binding domain-containing protein [Candidatus Limnocylindrales bacterium]|nr:cellulose binding domain-containing protein [Candidatus Limnocylindrales bacterium]
MGLDEPTMRVMLGAPRTAALTAALSGLALIASTVAVPAPASAASGCSARYTVGANWGSGLQAQLALTPGAPVTAWSVSFDVMPQQVVTFAAYATLSQSGQHVTLGNASFNGNVPAGSTVTIAIGIHTNPTGSNIPPSGFVLDGQTCAYTPQPYVVASTMRPVVAEGGSTTLTIQLSRAPTMDTILRLPNAAGGVITATPVSLTFTPTNWNVPQAVTISSAEDADTTGQPFWLPIQQQNYTPPQNYISAVPMITQIDND